MPHVIDEVQPGSIADQLGIRAGDILLSINGKHPVDLIDYHAFTCTANIALTVRRADDDREYRFTKDPYEPLGLRFGRPLISGQRDCVNQCVFCFVDQLPQNVRPTLRVKDDDWRMSLMMGNYVTLTNVSDAELTRIIKRRAAPLYISVHATDPALRAYMLGQPRAGNIMAQLTRLKQAGLTFHTQAVLCPGINDGAQLTRTVDDLAALYPACRSLALVPVGLTRHRDGLPEMRPFTRAEAEAVVDAAARWRASFEQTMGDPFVHPADEFYLIAGRELPPDAAYGDYPQLENGVGLLRLFEREYVEALTDADLSRVPPKRVAVACGTSFAPFLTRLLSEHPVPGVAVDVHALTNGFFGDTVTVSGLLTGGDIVRQMRGVNADVLLISGNMLREGGDVFLDDMTLDEARAQLSIDIRAVSGGAALLEALMEG